MARALICWFTGLSGAGKSTVSLGVVAQLEAVGLNVHTLDGDAVRAWRHRHLGFTESEIKENNRLIVELGVEKRDVHDVILVPIISPFAESRRQAREMGHDELTEWMTLAVHGTLHLNGFNDKTAVQRRRMFARQDRIIQALRPSVRRRHGKK